MESLIFFDLETTGLPSDGPNNPLLNPNKCKETPNERTFRLEQLVLSDSRNVPRITEMSFVCVPRALFLAALKRMAASQFISEDGQDSYEHMAMASNVHTRQVDPQLTAQEWAKYEALQRVTPSILLKKSDLEWKCTFGQEWPGVCHLLEVCPKPACLIAHNGVNFDFRLLFHELQRANAIGRHPLPEKVFFLDSLSTFLDIELEHNREVEFTIRNIDWAFVFSQSRQVQEQREQLLALTPNRGGGAGEGEGRVLDLKVEELDEETAMAEMISSLNDSGDEDDIPKTANCAASKLETAFRRRSELEKLQKTPERKRKLADEAKTKALTVSPAATATPLVPSPGEPTSARRALPFSSQRQLPEDHPVHFMRKNHWSLARKSRINKEHFRRDGQGEWVFDSQMARRELTKRGNFRLETLHNRLFSTPFKNHRAQADCEALMQVCLTYGEDFLFSLDKNASAFPDCFRKATNRGKTGSN